MRRVPSTVGERSLRCDGIGCVGQQVCRKQREVGFVEKPMGGLFGKALYLYRRAKTVEQSCREVLLRAALIEGYFPNVVAIMMPARDHRSQVEANRDS